jgi:gluconate 2-dehydrogenase gamma chain
MEHEEFSRRSLLQGIVAAIAAGALPSGWSRIAHAGGPEGLSFLSAAEAADVDAVTAQIIPTDDTPGAREAGVVHFIDRALGTFLAHLAVDYRAQLTEFQSAFRARYPDVPSFASLGSDAQIAYLKTVDRTPFFEGTRVLALLGMFTSPEYGGNRDGIGWKLIGFEAQHMFQPPFGFYDRDYPGFAPEPAPSK